MKEGGSFSHKLRVQNPICFPRTLQQHSDVKTNNKGRTMQSDHYHSQCEYFIHFRSAKPLTSWLVSNTSILGIYPLHVTSTALSNCCLVQYICHDMIWSWYDSFTPHMKPYVDMLLTYSCYLIINTIFSIYNSGLTYWLILGVFLFGYMIIYAHFCSWSLGFEISWDYVVT